MSNGRSLGSGGFKPAGSLSNIIVIVLVVVVLILSAGVFMLYNQEKGANNDATAAKQAYGALNDSYNDLSGKYTALVANNADMSERYDLLETEFNNVSSNYASLKNQSDTTTWKLGEFLENDRTVAYNYKIYANAGDNGSTTQDVRVNVYNVCSTDVNNVIVIIRYSNQTSTDINSIGEFTKTIASIPTLSNRSVDFSLDNTTKLQGVWVNLG